MGMKEGRKICSVVICILLGLKKRKKKLLLVAVAGS